MTASSRSTGDLALYFRLLRYVLPQWPLFLLSFLGFAMYASAQAGFADLLQFLIDTVGQQNERLRESILANALLNLTGNSPSDMNALRWLIPLAAVLVAIWQGVGFFTGNYFINHIARHLVHSLRMEMFSRLLRAPAAEFDRASTGHLMATVTYNVEQVTGAATNAIKVVVREGLTVIFLVTVLLYMNWRLALVFACVAPVIGLIVGAVGKSFRRVSRRMQTSMGDVNQVLNETIGGYREVRMFGGIDYETRRFGRASGDNLKQSMKMALLNAVSPPVIQLLIACGMSLVIFMALDPQVLASMTPGGFVKFIGAAAMIAKPVKQLSEVQSMIQRGLAGAESVFAFVDRPCETDTGDHRVERVRGELEFRQVSFAYAGEGGDVLKDISFSVRPGQTVALVGRSGSGKSTLVGLLARLYEHDRGEILLDGVEIRRYALDNLRNQIAMVSQQVTLFNDTVLNNIAYGSLADAPRTAVEQAARSAHALEFIERLPQGFDTEVGDDGDMLSGGQRQRIAIARALLKDAPLLILDEATSALDNDAERQIQAALETVMEGRTTLVIAHRLSTVEKADLILVMEDGRIVEQGAHQTLLQQGGRYAQLYQGGLA